MMELKVVKYGDPVLRKKGARIERITPEIAELVEAMLDTMEEAYGVGLAAQQVGRALQLTVIDVTPASDERPSTMEIDGGEVDPLDYMPLVLINPELKPFGQRVAGIEGCLSFPEIYDDIIRPESVEVTALNQEGETIRFKCGGLLSRAVQHETDHLNGILFIDRMDQETRARHRDAINALKEETKAELKKERESGT